MVARSVCRALGLGMASEKRNSDHATKYISRLDPYETALKPGKFVLIALRSMDDTTHAKEILNRTKPETLEHHQ